jgi:O-antigen ligase
LTMIKLKTKDFLSGFVRDFGGFSELVWLTVILLTPLFFWPATFTSFELPKVTLFRALTFILLVSLIFSMAKRKKVALRSARSERAGLQARAAVVESAATRLGAPMPQPEILAKPSGRSLILPLILLGLTVASWILSTALSPAPAVSFFGYYPRFQGLYTLLNYIFFSTAVFLAIENRHQIERILNTIVAASLLVAALAFLQSWGVPWLNFWDNSSFLGRFFGTMGHPDYLGSFLVIAIPIQIERIVANKVRLLAIPALSASLAALYFTLSRAAFLGFFISLIVLLAAACKKKGLKKLFIASFLTPLLLLTAVIAVNIFQKNDLIKNNLILNRIVLKDENLRSVETRLALWPATIKQILDSPLIGYGADTFAITFPKYAPPILNTLENLGNYPDRAHNFLLDYAQQFGIPALLGFLGLIGVIFYKGFRFVFKRTAGWLTPLALISSLTGLLIANFFGFFVTVTWLYFWLILALLLKMASGTTLLTVVKPAKKANQMPCQNQPMPQLDWGRSFEISAKAPCQKQKMLKRPMRRRLPNAKSPCQKQKMLKREQGFSFAMARYWTASFCQSALSNYALYLMGALVVIAGSAAVTTQDLMLFKADLFYRLSDLNRAKELAPMISYYHYRHAEVLTEAGNISAANSALARMGALTGYDGLYYLQKGILAATTFVQSTTASNPDPDLNTDSADFLAFEIALQKMPAYAPAYRAYGEALYKRAVALDPAPLKPDATTMFNFKAKLALDPAPQNIDATTNTGPSASPNLSKANHFADSSGANQNEAVKQSDSAQKTRSLHDRASALYARAAEVLQQYLDICPRYYLWKSDLGAHSLDEQNRYRIFYKLNPDFNDIFPLIASAYAHLPQTKDNAAKAAYYNTMR